MHLLLGKMRVWSARAVPPWDLVHAFGRERGPRFCFLVPRGKLRHGRVQQFAPRLNRRAALPWTQAFLCIPSMPSPLPVPPAATGTHRKAQEPTVGWLCPQLCPAEQSSCLSPAGWPQLRRGWPFVSGCWALTRSATSLLPSQSGSWSSSWLKVEQGAESLGGVTPAPPPRVPAGWQGSVPDGIWGRIRPGRFDGKCWPRCNSYPEKGDFLPVGCCGGKSRGVCSSLGAPQPG